MSDTPADAPPAAATPPRGLGFRTELVLGVCGLVLLTGAVVLWLAHRSARAGTETLTRSVFREVSGRAVAHARGFVERAAPVVESLAELADKGLAVDDPDRLAPQLVGVLKANPGLSWVSYGDDAGTFTGAYRTPAGGLRTNRSRIVAGKTKLVESDVTTDGTTTVVRTDDDSGYDPRTRPFYTKAKRVGRLVWLPPYVFYNQGVPGISCAVPVKGTAGTLRGVLSVDFDLNALSEFVSSLSVSEHSRVFLFTGDQILLAFPGRRVSTAADARGEGKLLTLANAGDPLVDAYRANLQEEHFPVTGDEAFHRFEFPLDGTDYLGSETAFKVGDDQTWVVGVVAPKSDFVGDVWRTQALALAAAAAAVLAAVAMAFLLANAVARPVVALTGFVRKVGGGDLDAKADIGGGAEFRELSAALNRMIADLRDRLRLRHSLDLAMQVQQQLLPAKAPAVPGLDLAGHSTYCDETGGDYYDFLVLDQTSGGSLMVALGDVMGHGVAAALVMASARAVLRDRATAGGLADLTARLNDMLATSGDRFMTLHLSIVDPAARTFRWTSAGHDPAFVYNPSADAFTEDASGGLPLGVMPGAAYDEYSLSGLKPGHVILIGTDGVWEMPNGAGDAFGKDRLRDVIRASAGGTAAEISVAVRDCLEAFRGDAKRVDDVTFVVVKVC
jgi:serine phosphatase RsbU (regulator of sigma subunit)